MERGVVIGAILISASFLFAVVLNHSAQTPRKSVPDPAPGSISRPLFAPLPESQSVDRVIACPDDTKRVNDAGRDSDSVCNAPHSSVDSGTSRSPPQNPQ